MILFTEEILNGKLHFLCSITLGHELALQGEKWRIFSKDKSPYFFSARVNFHKINLYNILLIVLKKKKKAEEARKKTQRRFEALLTVGSGSEEMYVSLIKKWCNETDFL